VSKLNVDEISDVDNTGPVTITDGLIVSSGGIVSSGSAVLTTATAGVPINGPAFSAYRGGTQAYSSNTYTKIQLIPKVLTLIAVMTQRLIIVLRRL
jgi:hypothetical protein